MTPNPLPVTRMVTWTGSRSNDANTIFSPSIVSAQVFTEPEQAPDQPANTEPGSGAAVKRTGESAEKEARHRSPQSTPAGKELTFPVPAPCFAVESGAGAVAVGRGE
jgi:hypothetical protein